MHDIKWIRQHPDAFDAALARRGLSAQSAELLALDQQRRAEQTALDQLLAKRNQLAKAIGQAKAKGENADAVMEESRTVNAEIAALEAKLTGGNALDDALMKIPNLLAADVPDGADEHGNQCIATWGEPTKFAFTPKAHEVLGPPLGMDFDAGSALSGTRFTVLRGQLARLERALAQFMLDMHTSEFGYTEIAPPFLVKAPALAGTGQLPKFAEDLFTTTTDYWLIPTAEVPLTNLAANQILDAEKLPLRYTAFTPCFRAEAGAAGRDTKGMIRQHQFSKVELVSITTPEQSAEEHERMTGIARKVLERLGLPYRVMLLCAGDSGFGAQKTYDLEVWLPGQDAYREISSCSNCGPFQARRMKARFRQKGAKETEFVHTLNGSALAVGRTMIAIMENYQNEDGGVRVPDALRAYMGGIESIVA